MKGLGSKLLKGAYIGDFVREYFTGYWGDTRSLDYSSYVKGRFIIR